MGRIVVGKSYMYGKGMKDKSPQPKAKNNWCNPKDMTFFKTHVHVIVPPRKWGVDMLLTWKA